jgi:hypothetical protein
MKENKFEILPLPIHKVKEQQIIQLATSNVSNGDIRISVWINNELSEKLKDYVYWERITQQDVLLQALEEFLKNKNIKSRPESVKNRKRAGRKRKYN